MGVRVVWQEKMTFEVQQDGHTFLIDAAEAVGGRDLGPKPKALLLSALAGCTGMDVISILGKMRIPVERFAVSVEAEQTEEHPKRYTSARVRYELWGEGLEDKEKKVRRAVTLSEENYCGVFATLRPSMALTTEIVVNDQLLAAEAQATAPADDA
jgi:putative redox protein